MTLARKIGEVFEGADSKFYKVVEDDGTDSFCLKTCAFAPVYRKRRVINPEQYSMCCSFLAGECDKQFREDNKSVHFEEKIKETTDDKTTLYRMLQQHV